MPYREAVALGQRGGQPGNQNAAKDKSGNEPNNVRLDYGNSGSYTLARLDRDHPELAAEVRAELLTAYRAACEKAGIAPRPDAEELLRALRGSADEALLRGLLTLAIIGRATVQ